MSSFIKLNNIVLNTRYITNIKIYQDLYRVRIISNHSGHIFLGFGFFDPEESFLDISKEINEEDYVKITEWISKT